MVMTDISDKILQYLEEANIDVSQVDYKSLTDRDVGALQRPAINIAINAGVWEKVTLKSKKLNLDITLMLVIQNLKGEKHRRYNVLDLIETVSQSLFLVTLDLPLQDKITPVSFTNITDKRYNDAGFVLYELKFKCSYIQTETVQDLGMLRKIVNSIVHNDSLPEEITKESIVKVGRIDGGNANSENELPSIDGGKADSDNKGVPWVGGKANSTTES